MMMHKKYKVKGILRRKMQPKNRYRNKKSKLGWKYTSMLLNIFQIQLILVAIKTEFHSYISDDNEQYACDSNAHMFHLLKIICVSNISVWYNNIMGRY